MTEEPLREFLEGVKASCLAEGIRLSSRAFELLSQGGTVPLTVHEYATTGGVTFELEGGVYVNAPFDEWYCATSSVSLEVMSDRFVIQHGGCTAEVVRVLPLPGFLGRVDNAGRLVTDVCMSHGDRIRLSPISGCVYDCAFCDIPGKRYARRPAEQILAALVVAGEDQALPPRHVLISGGSPGPRDESYLEDVCTQVCQSTPLPVDVMMAATGDPGFVDRVVDAGVTGFSLNIELFGESSSRVHIPRKHTRARPAYEPFAQRAVQRLGRDGSVRALILVGLESPEDTIAGVEYLASLGVDPVLSPFRPAQNTRLEHHQPPSTMLLLDLLSQARNIANQHGVALGPRCVPCQHNTLTFPWDVRAAAVALP